MIIFINFPISGDENDYVTDNIHGSMSAAVWSDTIYPCKSMEVVYKLYTQDMRTLTEIATEFLKQSPSLGQKDAAS